MRNILLILMLEYLAFSILLLMGNDSPIIYYSIVGWSFLNTLIVPSLLIRKFWIRMAYVFLWIALFLVQILFFIIYSIWPNGVVPPELFLLVSLDGIPGILRYHARYLVMVVIGITLAGLIWHFISRKRAQFFSLLSKKVLICFWLLSFLVLGIILFTHNRAAINSVLENYTGLLGGGRIEFADYEKYGAHFPFSESLDDIQVERGRNLVHIFLESTEKNFLDDELFPELCPKLSKYMMQAVIAENMDISHHALFTFGGIYATYTGKWLSPYSHGNDVFLQSEETSISLPLILNKAGYEQIFIYGHKNAFGGFESYLEKQGFVPKRIEAATQSYVADEKVFIEGLKEFKRLSATKRPFNLTLLTVNAHGPNGMILEDMNLRHYSHQIQGEHFDLLDVIHTTDSALGNFLDALSKEPNFKDTTIVIQSDHLAPSFMISGVLDQLSLKSRKMLFLILNSVKKGKIVHPAMTFDIAPTILSAMGVKHNAVFLFGTDLFAQNIDTRRLVYSAEQEKINSQQFNVSEIRKISVDTQNGKPYLQINEDSIPIISSKTQLPYDTNTQDICFLGISPLNTYSSVMQCYKNSLPNAKGAYILYGASGAEEILLNGIKIPPFSRYLIFRQNNGEIVQDVCPMGVFPHIEVSL